MAMKPEEYFRGLLNKEGRTVPEEHKPYFDKKVEEVKAKNRERQIATPDQVAEKIKQQNAAPIPQTTEQKVNMFKEKYKHLLPPKA